MKRRSATREDGLTIVMLAIFIVILFTMAALAIDMGVLYTARTSAQHAADAAALAGAFTFVDTPTAPQPTAAQNAAIGIAAQNRVLGQPVALQPSNVVVDTIARTVTVTVSRTGGNAVATFFARAMGVNAANVQTIARAQASKWASGSYCVKPIYIPNTALSSSSVSAACSGYSETIFDASHTLTSYAWNHLGSTMLVRPLGGSSSVVPSQYGSLDFGSGASTYQCAIEQCLNQCAITQLSCNDPFIVETGNMDGPTRQGVNNLIGNPADQWQALGEYVSNGVCCQDTSKSLVPVVVWDNCTQTISSGKNGQAVNIIGYATVFITGVNGSGVSGRFVSASGCSLAGGSGGTSGTGPMAVPVRLVQTY